MSRKAKFALDERRTSDGAGQAEAGGEEDRVLSPTTTGRPRGGLTGSEGRRGAGDRQFATALGDGCPPAGELWHLMGTSAY